LINISDKTLEHLQSISSINKLFGCLSSMVLSLFSKWEPQIWSCYHPSAFSETELQRLQPAIILLSGNKDTTARSCIATK